MAYSKLPDFDAYLKTFDEYLEEIHYHLNLITTFAHKISLNLEDLYKEKDILYERPLFKVIHEIIVRSLLPSPPSEIVFIRSIEGVLSYCTYSLSNSDREQVLIFYLDIKKKLIDHEVLQKGTINHVALSFREIVKEGIWRGASSIILVHNHPSGDPFPSHEDKRHTRNLLQFLGMAEVSLLDHLIIGKGSYFSFRERGALCGG